MTIRNRVRSAEGRLNAAGDCPCRRNPTRLRFLHERADGSAYEPSTGAEVPRTERMPSGPPACLLCGRRKPLAFITIRTNEPPVEDAQHG